MSINLKNKPWPLGETYTCEFCGAEYKLDKDSLSLIDNVSRAKKDDDSPNEDRTADIKCALCNCTGKLHQNPPVDENAAPSPDMTPAVVTPAAKVNADDPVLTTRDGTIPQTFLRPEQAGKPADERDDLTPGKYAHLKMHESAAAGPDLLPHLRDDQEAGTVAYSRQTTDAKGDTRIRTEGRIVTDINTVGDYPLPDSQEALIESRADLPVNGEPGVVMSQKEATPTGKLKTESARLQRERDITTEVKEVTVEATDAIKATPEVKADKRAADAKASRQVTRSRAEAEKESETVAPHGDAFGTVQVTLPADKDPLITPGGPDTVTVDKPVR